MLYSEFLLLYNGLPYKHSKEYNIINNNIYTIINN